MFFKNYGRTKSSVVQIGRGSSEPEMIEAAVLIGNEYQNGYVL